MGRLEEIRKRVLGMAENKNMSKKPIKESRMSYDENMTERINPKIAKQLREKKTTIGNHPALPADDEMTFEEKVMSKRFTDVVNNYKRQFDTNEIDQMECMMKTQEILGECMKMESSHKKELEELAVEMIMKEYDITDDDVEIIAELVQRVTLEGMRQNPSPVSVNEMEFENHDSVAAANGEVYKRRFINAMNQGASKKGHHMFHLADNELTGMNPTLPSKYAKLMAAGDYAYLANDIQAPPVPGGRVNVEFPEEEGGKAKIHAQAIVFPVLIHELIKGCMELLSSHGLPEDQKLTEYVIGKADYTNAEIGDMQLGPALWERFTNCFEAKDFDKKHHVYAELVSLPVEEFNQTMREVMLNSKEGKAKVRELCKEIQEDMDRDAYEQSMAEMSNDDNTMGLDDLDDIDFDDLL